MSDDRIETAEACAWCAMPAAGTARQGMDERHPSCGFGHGNEFVASPAGAVPATGLRVTRARVGLRTVVEANVPLVWAHVARCRQGDHSCDDDAPENPDAYMYVNCRNAWVRGKVEQQARVDTILAALGVTVADGEVTRESEAAHAALCDAEALASAEREADRLALAAAHRIAGLIRCDIVDRTHREAALVANDVGVERLADIVQTLANDVEVENFLRSNAELKLAALRSGIDRIVERYGNAPGIEKCATMYDLRRLAGDL